MFIQSSFEVIYSFNWCMTLRMTITNQSPSMDKKKKTCKKNKPGD